MGYVHLTDAEDRFHLSYIEGCLKSGGVRYFIPPRNISPYSGSGSLSVYVHPKDLERSQKLIDPPDEEERPRYEYHKKRQSVKPPGEALSPNGRAILLLIILLGVLLLARHFTY